MRTTLVFAFLFIAVKTLGVDWFSGSIVLRDNSVKVGEVAVLPAFDAILFRDSIGSTFLSARKVISFRYYDHHENINRKYISTTEMKGNVEQFRLFEVVLNSETKILRHIRSTHANPSNEVESFSYYILFEGRLASIDKFASGVFPFMVAHTPEFAEVVAQKRLSTASKADIIRIVQLYNLYRELGGNRQLF